MTNRTPGPWTVTIHPDTEGAYTILEANREQRHWVSEGFDISDEEGVRRSRVAEEHSEGNRRLIEAAPDLLERLREAVNQLEYLAPEQFDDEVHERQWSDWIRTLHNTIAKATG
jgi:hypothetical protein